MKKCLEIRVVRANEVDDQVIFNRAISAICCSASHVHFLICCNATCHVVCSICYTATYCVQTFCCFENLNFSEDFKMLR